MFASNAFPYNGILDWRLCSTQHEHNSPQWSIASWLCSTQHEHSSPHWSIVVRLGSTQHEHNSPYWSTIVKLCSAQHEHNSPRWSTVVRLCSVQHEHNSPHWSTTIRQQVGPASTIKHRWSSNRHIRSWLRGMIGWMVHENIVQCTTELSQ